ncbi:DUF2628 domain-containing protein [Hymenobacter perfusus]|uniref:DUF2628 domain-containing protein n=1 Tax=Hymenobacter perfusus TaxID=1236770 RepID=A0A428KBH0_9BACT|nr:DUF2628 domain-containing protein [Hymenobacter perfusus]RSK43552.1 DUF2628 domain-containing protein [Hymenobacter perfusus]
MSSTFTPQEIEEEYVWNFFGRNAEYYLQTWRLRQQGKYITFNAAAFFLGLFWFLYRRMYLVSVLIVALLTLEAEIEKQVTGVQRGIGATVLISLVNASLLGFFANSLYLWHAERKMRKLLALGLPREELLARLRRAGGNSWWAILVVLLFALLVVWANLWLSQHAELAGR